MKKSSQISLGLLIIIVGSLCLSYGAAQTPNVTPYGYWGTSPGDELCYRVSSDETGSWIDSNVTFFIEDNYNGSADSNDYNFLSVSIYDYTHDSWIEEIPIPMTGYNETTYLWYGGGNVSLGLPIPAPIPFNATLVNHSIYIGAIASGWGTISSSITNGTQHIFSYSNGTDSLIVTYDTATGICLNNTAVGSSFNTVIDCQCPWIKSNPFIPGYEIIVIFSVITANVAAIIWIIQRKKKQ